MKETFIETNYNIADIFLKKISTIILRNLQLTVSVKADYSYSILSLHFVYPRRGSLGSAPPTSVMQISFFRILIPEANCSSLLMSDGGRTSVSKMANGMASVATAFGTSTIPLILPSQGMQDNIKYTCCSVYPKLARYLMQFRTARL